MHPRQVIRDRITTELSSNLPVDIKVFNGLRRPLEQREKPAVLIRGVSESVAIESMRNVQQSRSFVVQVAVIHDTEDDGDELAKMVEIVLARPASIRNLGAEIELTDVTIQQEQQEQRDCIILMSYTIEYSAQGDVLSLVS